MPIKIVYLSSIAILTILAASVVGVVTLTQFGILGIAQGQVNSTLSLTPQQKAAICDPNNPSSKLNPVNTTESKICGIPVTVKPHLSNTTSANTTTDLGPSAVPSLPSE
jgi:cell division protein FtsN